MAADGPRQADIIVVGGGIAGLKAAIDSAQHGKHVILLEAKDRLGGRIYTETMDDGAIVEMGASYWEGNQNSPFFKKYFANSDSSGTKPSTHFLGFELSEFYTADGNQVDTIQVLELLQTSQNIIERGYREGKNIGCENVKQFVDKLNYSGTTVQQQYIAKQIITALLVEMATSPEEQTGQLFYYGEPDLLEEYHQETALNTFVSGGYHLVIEQMKIEAEALGVEIITNTPVKKIDDQGDQVVIIDHNDASYTAKKVICAIPGTVLKNQPELISPSISQDKEKRDALDCMGTHEGCRVILEFEQPFWKNKEGSYIFITSIRDEKLLQFRNATAYAGKPILSTDSYAKIAQEYLKDNPDKVMAEKMLVDTILNDLQAAYPNQTIPRPRAVRIHNWSTDPYAQGAYPYYSTQAKQAHKEYLQRPHGNIHFAGDYTSKFSCSIHNAYASGMRAAHEVEHSLKKTSRKKI